MGQMTCGIMLGCRLPKAPKGKAWWGESEEVDGKWVYREGLLEMCDPEPDTDENSAVIGFFVAVGASGKRGAPSLTGPIDLAAVGTDKRYAKAIKRALTQWAKAVAFLAGHGVALDEPRLWLVETEVA